MLVVSSKIGDSLQIGEGITVRVLDIQNGRVRLGIEAPKATAIKRACARIAEKKSAVKKDLDNSMSKSDTISR